MATEHTKIPRTIKHFKTFLDFNYNDFSLANTHINPKAGFVVKYSNPYTLYGVLDTIVSNLFELGGLAELFVDSNPASDAEIINRLKGFKTYLKKQEELFKDMSATLQVYGFVEGTVYDIWSKTLGAVELALELAEEDKKALKAKEQKGYEFDIGIIVATTEEHSAVRKFVKERKEIKATADDTAIYTKGYFKKGETKKSVILTQLPFMGMQAAAIAAAKMILHYKPRYLVMVGHAAGNKEFTKLGNIVVADTTLDYNQVVIKEKEVPVGDNKEKIIEHVERTKPLVIDGTLLTIIRKYEKNTTLLNNIKKASPDNDKFPDELKIKVGKIVSGGALLRSKETFDLIKKNHSQTMGLDMEAYAIFYAAHNVVSSNKPIPLVIKAVSDYGENERLIVDANTRVCYACYNSARLLFEIAINEL